MCHKVRATRAQGIPLAAEIKERYDKIILLDVGLCSAILDLTLHEQFPLDTIELINKGGIAEQLVGQLLRTTYPLHKNPALYYWLNTDKGASAEVDYIIQHRGQVVPIEVKAGAVGKLKSLHYFMAHRQLPFAVTINSGMPCMTEVNHKDSLGNNIAYQLRSIPFYLIGQINRLLP